MPPEMLSEADVRLITEIGFLGSGAGLVQPAKALFEALAVLRPWRDFPYIGLATLQLNNKQPDDAVRILEQARKLLASKPDSTQEDQAMLAAFHGVALHCAQRCAESQQVMQSVLQMGYHSDHARRIAHTMLGVPLV
jgi:hypothetical protein